ncbi:alpha/beta hydrolase [Acidimicrobiaceae bacterium]|nr:alpha/beta hydrolase [Acidimicrobiaceae bacterium]
MEKINLNNISLSYETKGQGSDVLLLHGFPSSMYMWNEIKKELIENGYRVTIVEQRGYPLSRLKNFDVLSFNIEELSKDIEELIIKLNLDQNLTIVGHDWGSIVAWAVTSRENIDTKKIVSICGGTEFPLSAVYNNLTFKGKPHYISSFQNVKETANIIDNNLESFFRSAYRRNNQIGENVDLSLENVFINYISESCVLNENEIIDLIQHFDEFSLDQPIAWYANIDLNSKLSSSWRKIVTTPVHFIFGEVDAAVKLNDKMRERLISSGTNVKITEIPGAGHWLPITHRESVLKEIYV